MNEEITNRVKRIYAAIQSAVEELNFSKFNPKVINTPEGTCLSQDFKGDLSDEQIENIAFNLIHNIANLKPHIKQWASQNGKDKSLVEKFFNGSFALKIIQDLSDREKHSSPSHKGGYSDLSPYVIKFFPVLKMIVGPSSSMHFSINPQTGEQAIVTQGEGAAKVVITGVIQSDNGTSIGDFHEISMQAVKEWETLLDKYGLIRS